MDGTWLTASLLSGQGWLFSGEAATCLTRKALTSLPVATSRRGLVALAEMVQATVGVIPCPATWATIRPRAMSTTQTRPPRSPAAAQLPSGETANESRCRTSDGNFIKFVAAETSPVHG